MSTSPNKSVQRAATRAPLGRPIRLQADDSMEVIEGVCINISIGGMFIRSTEIRPQGSLLRFELPLDDGASVRGLGEVVWMRPKSAGPGSDPGIGIKFRFLEQRDRQLIYKLVSQYIKERLSKKSAVQAETPEPVARPAGVFQPPEPMPGPALSPRDSAAGEGLTGFDPPTPLSPAELSARAVPPTGGGRATAHPDDRPVSDSAPSWSDQDPGMGEPARREWDPGSYDAGSYDDVGEDDDMPYRGHGVAPSRRRPSPRVVVGLGVMVVVLVLAFLFRDHLFGGGPEPPGVTGGPGVTQAPPATSAPATSASPDPVSPNPPTMDPAATPSGAAAGEEPPSTAGTEPPPPEPAVTTAPPPPPRPNRSGYTRIIGITWREAPGGLRVIFEGDGPITAQRYRYFRLDGDPAREVIQFQGVEEGFEPTRLDVGGPGVEQIRTGFHRKRGGGDELHVVMDMTSREARVVEKRSVGFALEVLVSTGTDR